MKPLAFLVIAVARVGMIGWRAFWWPSEAVARYRARRALRGGAA